MRTGYFAYGSNMSSARLLARVPEAVPVGAARLVDWQLGFDKPARDGSAKANIAPAAGSVVWGVVWTIPETAWPTLDRFEPRYERVPCPVTDDAGQLRSAHTYLYRGPGTDAAPLDWYVEHLIVGAHEHRLPDDYTLHLTMWRGRAATSR